MESLSKKFEKLKNLLREMDRVAIAFSAGVDSTFLAKVAHDVLGDNMVAYTVRERCYFCKRNLFSKITERAKAAGFSIVCEGSNADDIHDYRPGMRALQELGIRSPLLECGLTKADIRELSATGFTHMGQAFLRLPRKPHPLRRTHFPGKAFHGIKCGTIAF